MRGMAVASILISSMRFTSESHYPRGTADFSLQFPTTAGAARPWPPLSIMSHTRWFSPPKKPIVFLMEKTRRFRIRQDETAYGISKQKKASSIPARDHHVGLRGYWSGSKCGRPTGPLVEDQKRLDENGPNRRRAAQPRRKPPKAFARQSSFRRSSHSGRQPANHFECVPR